MAVAEPCQAFCNSHRGVGIWHTSFIALINRHIPCFWVTAIVKFKLFRPVPQFRPVRARANTSIKVHLVMGCDNVISLALHPGQTLIGLLAVDVQPRNKNFRPKFLYLIGRIKVLFLAACSTENYPAHLCIYHDRLTSEGMAWSVHK